MIECPSIRDYLEVALGGMGVGGCNPLNGPDFEGKMGNSSLLTSPRMLAVK